ncbi:MAG: hypothetical protein RMJ56_12020 [Gemmataceae bacterium]|nr:hypothetical protein [Gemmata sp.]MDW8198318.1 hypothetical protein [Gemmataceae bacterium]
MNPLAAWKKILLFGLLGAIGAYAGALAGEPFILIMHHLIAAMGYEETPSLITTVPAREPPPPPAEFVERLRAAGAKTGDVQISLIWFNTNDLDLHCVDPSGFEIFWRSENRRSRTGGELDVDRNANCKNLTAEPVENIYWPPGKAPLGKYQVYLNYYLRCPGAPDETNYKISVLHGSQRQEFSGTIRKADTPDGGPKRLIYEFQLAPRIELYAPRQFQLAAGQSLTLPVAVRREFYDGTVTIRPHRLPAGLSATPLKLELSSRKSEGELTLHATTNITPGDFSIELEATGEDQDIKHTATVQVTMIPATFSLYSTVATGVWTALLAAGLCAALVMGQNWYLGKSLLATGRVRLALLVAGAIAAGFLSGSLGQVLYFVLINLGIATVGLILGWLFLGLLLGAGVSFFIPNLDVKKAILAGATGGFWGGVAFTVLSLAADILGRWGGAVILGFCIGLMVAVVEAVFRRAWLEVWLNDRESITVNLGPEPVKIGSDARACTVWARDAAPIALRYWIREGQLYCEDTVAQREVVVGDGDRRRAGRATVIVRVATGASPVAARAAASHRQPDDKPPRSSGSTSPHDRPQMVLELDEPEGRVASPPSSTVQPRSDWDDGLPLPAGPPSTRPAPTSIVEADNPPQVRPAQPPAPAPARPPAPAGASGSPPPRPSTIPIPPIRPKPPAPPGKPTPGTLAPEGCPSCGRKVPGRPGQRYCMVCDKTF